MRVAPMLVACAALLGAALCAPSTQAQTQEQQRAAEQLQDVMSDPLFSRWELRQDRASEGKQSAENAWLQRQSDKLGNVFGDLLEWLFGDDSSSPSPSSSSASRSAASGASFGMLMKIAAWVVVGVVGLLLLWMIISKLRNANLSTHRVAPDRQMLDTALDKADALAADSDVWTHHARQLVQEGDLRLAFRAMYLALLSGMHQAGQIHYRPQRTNAWYVRGFRGERDQCATFALLTQRFGEVWYGQHMPDAATFQEITRDVDRLLAASAERPAEHTGLTNREPNAGQA